MKCKLFLTFDHELPLGGLKTSYQKALFEPTEKLLKLAADLEFPVTLFTDVLCGMRFREWDEDGFYKPYTEQLQKTISAKHDVQLHIHPHWLTTRFEGKTYYPSNDFRLADFSSNPNYTIESIIEKGVNFLNEIGRDVIDSYNCVAYRGGGYNLQPGLEIITDSLHRNGIRFDSSICKGYYFSSALSTIDYRNMPESPNWYIGPDVNIKKKSDAALLEIPIAGIYKSLFEIPTRFKMKRYAGRAPENIGSQIHEGKNTQIRKRLIQLFSSRMLSFDNYTYSSDYLMKILDYNIRKYQDYDNVMLCAIGHPKSMGDYSFRLLKEFVISVREKYKEQVQFYNYLQLNKELNIL